ncbi:hypothetical protein nbrc107696_45440 [Gordonia spumicola]|uniref:Uncharacterized protein n=1 Tax=Gordonia spumicola TaxID=589161 RepID=A0A7I9V2B0_9ACTN|nr:hypothetical protein [Gordonia spumicola]GED99557.1 hypothetical protein nbrc107696_00040 [Gordonia spumicola]GED99951.1 hypothetical protein nbrc107696_03980 [Gordonia spumicola]GEE04098.1 hypothetical protein nbrc107696_45440 [Gordonia spumicola]
MSENTQVAVVGPPTPMVLSVARRLRDGIARGEMLPGADGPRSVVLRAAGDAQRAHIAFTDDAVVVGAVGDAELVWEVNWFDPEPADSDAAGDFGKVVGRLLSARTVDWRTAAADFWARAGASDGMPTGLVVTCVDEEAEAVLGTPTTEGSGVLGTAAALAAFFDGRSTLVGALEGGEFGMNLSFPHFSALFGADLKVVCGEL